MYYLFDVVINFLWSLFELLASDVRALYGVLGAISHEVSRGDNIMNGVELLIVPCEEELLQQVSKEYGVVPKLILGHAK